MMTEAMLGAEEDAEGTACEASTPDTATAAPALPDCTSVCSNCGAVAPSQEMTDCRQCGYYSRLGTVLELADWDREAEELSAGEEEPLSHLDVWLRLAPTLLPKWVWLLLGCMLLVVVESVLVRVLTPSESRLRTVWSFSQLLLGCFTLLAVHTSVYVTAIMDDDSLNLWDILARPIACWSSTLNRLPETFKRVATASCAVVAIVMSTLVIGGLDYNRLLDWGIEKPAERNLLGAVMREVKKVRAKDIPLDEAMKDFAGSEFEEDDKDTPPPIELTEVDCVIVGIKPSRHDANRFHSLVLATTVKGTLKVVGTVATGIPAEIREPLNERLFELKSPVPFVQTTATAFWVEPRLTCRVTCEKRTQRGHLIGVEFKTLLQEILIP